jgi:hypothetical protein
MFIGTAYLLIVKGTVKKSLVKVSVSGCTLEIGEECLLSGEGKFED